MKKIGGRPLGQQAAADWCDDKPPCSPLLDDFAAVLADRERWPHHLCSDTATSVVKWWWHVLASTQPDGRLPLLSELTISRPMPLGAPGAGRRHGAGISRRRLFGALSELPFDGDERAAFATRVPLADGALDFFGLAAKPNADITPNRKPIPS
jgi:hypothetical protein